MLVQSYTVEKVKHHLNLIYDEHFLLLLKARYSEFNKLNTSKKLTLLLTSHLHFTNIVIRDKHQRVFHNGVNSISNFLHSKYWLIRGKQSGKSVKICKNGSNASNNINNC